MSLKFLLFLKICFKSSNQNQTKLINKSRARSLFESIMHFFIKYCVNAGGFKIKSDGTLCNEYKDYILFISDALESQNERFAYELFISLEGLWDIKQ